jgi:hypothetical protein
MRQICTSLARMNASFLKVELSKSAAGVYYRNQQPARTALGIQLA